jgi:adenylosuccinate lyase
METQLKAICPLDGRYYDKVKNLSKYFSEEAYIRYRIKIELKYLVFILHQIGNKIGLEDINKLLDYNFDDIEKVKEYEKETKHDVKAVEYYLREKMDKFGLSEYKEYLHIGLTSQDINTSMNILGIRDFLREEYLPNIENIVKILFKYGEEWKNIKMLSRTHGQPATPTTVRREIYVYLERLIPQIKKLKDFRLRTKFGGSVGNLDAHYKAFPKKNWDKLMNTFVKYCLGLERIEFTTQIHNYIELSELFDIIKRINTVLVDMCQDFWQYISIDYFGQKIKEGEVGSSTMPHKINPINFENAEGNFLLSITMLEFFSRKLPISRLQRDLTDSTILRNLGVVFGYTMVGIKSLETGLNKLKINKEKIKEDLENHPEVYAEAIQTIMRKHRVEDAYTKLRKLTQGKKITISSILSWIEETFEEGKLREELLDLF